MQTFERLADEARPQRLDVNDDIRQLGQLVFFQPLDNLFARPVMIVVQVQDDGIERQPLVAAFGAAASHVLEAVEEPIEPRADRRILVARQDVGAFVRGAERARSAVLGKILAERLRTPSRSRGDRVGELELIFARDLVHWGLQLTRILRLVAARLHLFGIAHRPAMAVARLLQEVIG